MLPFTDSSLASLFAAACGCVPCPKGDCGYNTYKNRCTSGRCDKGDCRNNGRREGPLIDRDDYGLEEDDADLQLSEDALPGLPIDMEQWRNGTTLQARTTPYKPGHWCLQWFHGEADPQLECDWCQCANGHHVCNIDPPRPP